jgi:hypothetical protein
MGVFGIPFFPCWKTGHLRQKRVNPVKTGTSHHPGLVCYNLWNYIVNDGNQIYEVGCQILQVLAL